MPAGASYGTRLSRCKTLNDVHHYRVKRDSVSDEKSRRSLSFPSTNKKTVFRMICHCCQRRLRRSDGRCSYCDLRCFAQCSADNDAPEAGDRIQRWRCALCQATAGKPCEDNSKEIVLNIIKALSEKFEVVNKIQLPKLSGDLAHIKHMSDHIAKQNEDILRKISDLENSNCQEKRSGAKSHSFRKRHVHLSHHHRTNNSADNNDHMPMMSTEKAARYRLRRRSYSYLLNRMLHLLSRKLNRCKMSPRKRCR